MKQQKFMGASAPLPIDELLALLDQYIDKHGK